MVGVLNADLAPSQQSARSALWICAVLTNQRPRLAQACPKRAAPCTAIDSCSSAKLTGTVGMCLISHARAICRRRIGAKDGVEHFLAVAPGGHCCAPEAQVQDACCHAKCHGTQSRAKHHRCSGTMCRKKVAFEVGTRHLINVARG